MAHSKPAPPQAPEPEPAQEIPDIRPLNHIPGMQWRILDDAAEYDRYMKNIK